MAHDPPSDHRGSDRATLFEAVVEIERHVAAGGWDQPARLYALAETADLAAREPALAARLGIDPASVVGRFTPVEQEPLPAGRPLDDVLASIAWPETVAGCALAVERIVLPPSAEEGMPEDDDEAAAWAYGHPDRTDVRIVVGVLRDGSSSCVLRVRGHDALDDLVREPAMSADLAMALAETMTG